MLCFVALSDIYAAEFEYFFNIKYNKSEKAYLTIALTDSPKLTYLYYPEYDYEGLSVSADNMKRSYTFPSDYQYTVYYTKKEVVPSAITNAIINNKIQKSGEDAIISGLDANEAVVVYGANGAKLSAAKADANGVAVVNLSSLSEGIIIIKTSNASFKIMNK